MKEYPIFLLPIAFRVELMCSIIDKFVEEIKQCPLPPPWGYFGMGAKFEYLMTSKSYIGMFSTARYHRKTRLGLRFKNLKISVSQFHCIAIVKVVMPLKISKLISENVYLYWMTFWQENWQYLVGIPDIFHLDHLYMVGDKITCLNYVLLSGEKLSHKFARWRKMTNIRFVWWVRLIWKRM